MFQIKSWLIPTALILVAMGFALLGRWQLERAEVNRLVEQSFERGASLPFLEAKPGDVSAGEHRYRRLRLDGRYDPTVQILLDNRTRDGRAGYEVLTLFAVAETIPADPAGPRVLVNRGWVPASWDRAELPDVSIAAKPVTIEGRIDRLPRAAFDLGSPAATDASPVVVLSFPEFEQIETVSGHFVHRFQLLLDDDQPDGYLRSWAPATDRDDRNIAYAVQWFALAALAASIAFGIAIRRYRKPRDAA